MSRRTRSTRREFLKRTVAAGSAAMLVPQVIPGSALGADDSVAPSERVTVGMLGVGRQVIAYNLRLFLQEPDCQVVALCDPDRWRLEVTNERICSTYGAKRRCGDFGDVARYTDFRDVLARDDVDAVMISTPDHWHVPMAAAAVKAGKDVALEKPITRSIAEGRYLADLVSQHGRIFRVDSEFRSIKTFHRAVELVRNGRIGQLHTIRSGVPHGTHKSPEFVEMAVPEELDYGMWVGPGPMKPYTEMRIQQIKGYERPGWMRVRDFCDGMITNWGTHLNDIAQWGNGTERTGPVEVEGAGVWPPKGSMWDVLMEFEVEYKFADGVKMIYKTDAPYTRFEGSEGWVQANFGRRGLEAEPESLLTAKIGPDEIHYPLKGEKRDFLDSVKSRKPTMEDAEVGHRTTSLCHLGLIAVQVGGRLRWDPDKEVFLNSDEANALRSNPPGREPWGIDTTGVL
jgi:predicted dehydrogenase